MGETALWQSILGELEKTIGKADFQTWLKPAKLTSVDNGVAVICVNSIFVRERLEKRYRNEVLHVVKSKAPDIKDVQFGILEGSKEETSLEDNPEAAATPTPAPRRASRSINPGATIIPTYTFDTFVVGNNSRLAYNVSLAIANNPGTMHNPLFIYGGVGLGKTHLMHAIANEMVRQDSESKVRYVSAETFTNDYIASLAGKKMDQFKKLYRTVDLLLVDDIQFMSSKEGSQEEFFNTFNTLHQTNRQIVIAADRPPTAILGLEERLSSRFSWGMVVDIQPPNLETRTAILQNKCHEKHVNVPIEVLDYIATRVHSNIRELEGVLSRTIIYCQTNNVPFSPEATRAALSGLITPATKPKHSPDAVLRVISEYYGIALDELIGAKRTKELVYPRQVAMYLMRKVFNMTYPVIAREMGGKDHTTIMYGERKIEKELASSPTIKHDITVLTDQLMGL